MNERQAAADTVLALSGFRVGDLVRRLPRSSAEHAYAMPPTGAVGTVEEVAPNGTTSVVVVRWHEAAYGTRFTSVANLELVHVDAP